MNETKRGLLMIRTLPQISHSQSQKVVKTTQPGILGSEGRTTFWAFCFFLYLLGLVLYSHLWIEFTLFHCSASFLYSSSFVFTCFLTSIGQFLVIFHPLIPLSAHSNHCSFHINKVLRIWMLFGHRD